MTGTCEHGASFEDTCQSCGRWVSHARPYVSDIRQVCPQCLASPTGECDYHHGSKRETVEPIRDEDLGPLPQPADTLNTAPLIGYLDLLCQIGIEMLPEQTQNKLMTKLTRLRSRD